MINSYPLQGKVGVVENTFSVKRIFEQA